LISAEAISYLLPFASTYLCETSFSALNYLKNKYDHHHDHIIIKYHQESMKEDMRDVREQERKLFI
jgi:hypothetical protein